MTDRIVNQIVEKLYATEPDPFEADPGKVLVVELLDTYIRQMRRHLHEHEALSLPCPEGKWRWADACDRLDGKTEEQVREGRAHHLARAAHARTQLVQAEATRKRVVEEGRL